jgi:membrane fusion protein (multidrug efflux system)
MFAQVQLTAAEKPDAVLVPREAVVQQPDGPVVFVADNGRASQRTLQLGMQDDKSYEVLSGVQPGEQVVVAGQNALRDGAPIQIVGQPGQGQGQQQQQRQQSQQTGQGG